MKEFLSKVNFTLCDIHKRSAIEFTNSGINLKVASSSKDLQRNSQQEGYN